MTYTLNGNDLGEIENEEARKWSDIDLVSYPLSDSKESSGFDYAGVKRVINIRGSKTFDSAEDLWNWVAIIDALQDGDQSTIIYHSDGWGSSSAGSYTAGNFNVKVDNFVVTHTNLIVLSVNYTIVLFECEAGV